MWPALQPRIRIGPAKHNYVPTLDETIEQACRHAASFDFASHLHLGVRPSWAKPVEVRSEQKSEHSWARISDSALRGEWTWQRHLGGGGLPPCRHSVTTRLECLFIMQHRASCLAMCRM